MPLTRKEMEAAQTLVAALKIGDRVKVDGTRYGVVVRHLRPYGWPFETSDDIAHIYVRLDGNTRAALLHGARLERAGV